MYLPFLVVVFAVSFVPDIFLGDFYSWWRWKWRWSCWWRWSRWLWWWWWLYKRPDDAYLSRCSLANSAGPAGNPWTQPAASVPCWWLIFCLSPLIEGFTCTHTASTSLFLPHHHPPHPAPSLCLPFPLPLPSLQVLGVGGVWTPSQDTFTKEEKEGKKE